MTFTSIYIFGVARDTVNQRTRSYVEGLRGSELDVGTASIGLPLTEAEFAEFERRELVLTKFSETLELEVRSREDFGGLYIDQHAGGNVIVLTTSKSTEILDELRSAHPSFIDSLIVKEVQFTWDELTAGLEVLFGLGRIGGAEIYSAAVEVDENALSVTVPETMLTQVSPRLQQVSDSLGGIHVFATAGVLERPDACISRTNCHSPMRAGIRIVSTSSSCTMGFMITIGGSRNFLTSGHCQGTTWAHAGYGNIGTSQGTLISQEVDVRRVSMPSSQHSNRVYLAPNNYTSITGFSWPIKNSATRGSLGTSNSTPTGAVADWAVHLNLAEDEVEAHPPVDEVRSDVEPDEVYSPLTVKASPSDGWDVRVHWFAGPCDIAPEIRVEGSGGRIDVIAITAGRSHPEPGTECPSSLVPHALDLRTVAEHESSTVFLLLGADDLDLVQDWAFRTGIDPAEDPGSGRGVAVLEPPAGWDLRVGWAAGPCQQRPVVTLFGPLRPGQPDLLHQLRVQPGPHIGAGDCVAGSVWHAIDLKLTDDPANGFMVTRDPA